MSVQSLSFRCMYLAFLCLGLLVNVVYAQARGIHDPCIIKEGETYVLFSTGGRIPMRRSADMVNWTLAGDTLTEIPMWARNVVPESRGLWAPDISHFNGKYHLYYSVSTFGKNLSCIGLATNVTLDPADPRYRWEDQGEVISSHPERDDFNAIDPNIVLDQEGQPWLSFGSFWSGLKLTRIDAQTGKAAGELIHIAGRKGGPIEAPFIIQHEGKYYLFVSFDFCCKGVDSTYKIMVGRSDTVAGPYLDFHGKPLTEGGGTLVLAGYKQYRGPGHNAILNDGERDLLVHHFYDASNRGRPEVQVRPLLWDEKGWPMVGEPDLSKGDQTPINPVGTWTWMVDYETNGELTLQVGGTIQGRSGATWESTGQKLTLSLVDSDGAVTRTTCYWGAQGRWFVGRSDTGKIWNGIRQP